MCAPQNTKSPGHGIGIGILQLPVILIFTNTRAGLYYIYIILYTVKVEASKALVLSEISLPNK